MDAIERLKLVSSEMHLEPAEDAGCPQNARKPEELYISKAVLPGGKQIMLLKTLLSSACERNCIYCPFRAGRDTRRATFKPEEMAKTYLNVYRAGVAQGIFLSSGVVGGGPRTQELLIDTAEILRKKLGYTDYIHLKCMPGATKDQVYRSMLLADRVSVNLEAPNTQRLQRLAPQKMMIEELVQPLRWMEEIRRTQSPHNTFKGYWPSSVTQFVVGAVGESDLELLNTSEALYRQARLRRTYFSAFHPVSNTPLEDHPAESPVREMRLYQASFLLRDYGFTVEDMPFDGSGSLPLDIDPKAAWAKLNLTEQPVEINHAGREDLLRVPGFGPKSVDAILKARANGIRPRIHDLSDLRKIGVNPTRAAPFIIVNGKRPAYQLSFNFDVRT